MAFPSGCCLTAGHRPCLIEGQQGSSGSRCFPSQGFLPLGCGQFLLAPSEVPESGDVVICVPVKLFDTKDYTNICNAF